MYINHLKLCVVCIYGQRYVCCSERNVLSDVCDEHTSCLGQPVGAHGGDLTADKISHIVGVHTICLARSNHVTVEGFSDEELNAMLNFIAVWTPFKDLGIITDYKDKR